MQVNKVEYKDAYCAKELKRNNLASMFSPSPKKVKLEANAESTLDASHISMALHTERNDMETVKHEQGKSPKHDSGPVKDDLEGTLRVASAT